MAHILHLLRNSTYSDKILAVIREYSCNALDANVEAGKAETPIQVTVPTLISPTFKIRDFGVGLSFQEIDEIFCCYGESTKRNSNTQVGMMGIGCKSGFAYGDNFLVVSYKDGVKTVYNCYLEASGCGEVAEMSVEKTGEPNGIEVAIPVRQSDIKDFEAKTVNFFKWWRIKPTFHGLTKTPDWKELTHEKDIVLTGAAGNWKLTNRGYYDDEISVAIMGNVAYPIAIESCGSLTEEEESLLRNGLILEVPIGTVEVANSREALQYSDFTIKNLKAEMAKILVEVRKVVEKEFSAAKSMIEAKHIMGTIIDNNNFLRRFAKLAMWNGHKVDSSYLWKPDDLRVTTYSRKHSGRNEFKTSRRGHHRVDCENAMFFVRDTATKISARIYELFDKNPKIQRVYLFTFEGQSKSEFKKENNVDPKDIPNISTVTPSALFVNPNSSKGGGGARNGFATGIFKAKLDEGAFTYGWGRRNYSRRQESWELTAVLPASGGIYVELDRYQIVLNGNPCEDYANLLETLKNFEKLGLLEVEKLEIYGATKARLKHFKGAKWSTLTAYLARLLENHIKEKGITSTETQLMSKLSDMGWGRALDNKDFIEYLPKKHPIAECAGVIRDHDSGIAKMKAIQAILQSRLGRALKIEIPEGTCDIEEKIKGFNEAYPLAKEAFAQNTWGRNPWKLIAEYVASMDELKELKMAQKEAKKSS